MVANLRKLINYLKSLLMCRIFSIDLTSSTTFYEYYFIRYKTASGTTARMETI